MRIAFIHFRNTRNTGDLASGPYNYIDLSGHDVSYHDINSKELPRKVDVCILGGGALGYAMGNRRIPELIDAGAYIGWGIGRSIKRFTGETIPANHLPKWLTLAGVRDHRGLRETGSLTYTPCASCLSPLFDMDPIQARGGVTLFNNAAMPSPFLEVDMAHADTCLDNRVPMETILQTFARSETVVTNSYHGALWGTWLGCRVIIYAPYSSKFRFMRHQPLVVNKSEQWWKHIPHAQAFPGALGLARKTTAGFIGRLKNNGWL